MSIYTDVGYCTRCYRTTLRKRVSDNVGLCNNCCETSPTMNTYPIPPIYIPIEHYQSTKDFMLTLTLTSNMLLKDFKKDFKKDIGLCYECRIKKTISEVKVLHTCKYNNCNECSNSICSNCCTN